MADVFLSYSRSDAAYVSALADGLRARGKTPWLDTEGIEDGEIFPGVLQAAIEAADGFVFVISPDAASSAFCAQEVEHAVALGKRIVPVLHRTVADEILTPSIRERQWVPGAVLDAPTLDRLVAALDVDPEHTRHHTRIGLRAGSWADRGRRAAEVPRGEELEEAAAWLVDAQGREPSATSLQAEWIAAGRAAMVRRQRRFTIGAVGVAAGALALVAVALVSRGDAIDARATAQSRALASLAIAEAERDPQRAVLLARQALARRATPDALLAGTTAVDANTARSQLRSIGRQSCTSSGDLLRLRGTSRVAQVTCDGRVVVQDLRTRRTIRSTKVGSTAAGLVASPSGRTLAVGTDEGVVLLDAATGRIRARVPTSQPVNALDYDRTGHRLALGSEGAVSVVDLRRRRVRRLAQGDPADAAVLDVRWADARRVLVAVTGVASEDLVTGLNVVDATTGRSEAVPLLPRATRSSSVFGAKLALTPDRRTWLLSGKFETLDGRPRARTWAVDARTRRVRWDTSGPPEQFASALAVSDDGREVGVGYALGRSEVLDVRDGGRLAEHRGPAAAVRGIAFTDQAAAPMATAGQDGVVRTWAVRGTERLRLVLPPIRGVGFARGGDLLTTGDRRRRFDRRSGRAVERSSGIPASAFFFAATEDLRFASFADQSPEGAPQVTVVDGRTGRTVGVREVPRGDIATLGVTSDGRAVIVPLPGTPRVRPMLMDVATGKTRQLAPAPVGPGCVGSNPRLSPSGAHLAYSDGCRFVNVWDTRSGRLLRSTRLDDRAVGAVAVSPDGSTVVATAAGGTLVRVDVASGAVDARPGVQDVVLAARFSPDGTLIAIGGSGGVVDLYDARSLRRLRRHVFDEAIEDLAFSPDGRRLAMADSSTTLRVHDTCDVCRDAEALGRLLEQQSVRALSRSERATFGADDG